MWHLLRINKYYIDYYCVFQAIESLMPITKTFMCENPFYSFSFNGTSFSLKEIEPKYIDDLGVVSADI